MKTLVQTGAIQLRSGLVIPIRIVGSIKDGQSVGDFQFYDEDIKIWQPFFYDQKPIDFEVAETEMTMLVRKAEAPWEKDL